MRYILLLPLLAGILLLAACETDTRMDQPANSDILTIDPVMADEFRADITSRLAQAESDINRLDQLMSEAPLHDTEQRSDDAREMRQELLEIRARLQTADIDSERFWHNDHRNMWSDSDELARRAERAVLENTTEPAALADETQRRMEVVDDQLATTDMISTDEHSEIQEHMVEIDTHVAQLETVANDEFEDVRDEIVDSFSDLRDMISDAQMRRVEQMTPREYTPQQPGIPRSEQPTTGRR